MTQPHPVNAQNQGPDLTGGGEKAPTSPLVAFSNPGYRWFWITLQLSLCSVWIQLFARGSLVREELTTSPLVVTSAFAAWFTPLLVAPLVAGVIGDRMDRKQILVVAEVLNVALALAAAVLVAFDAMNVVLLFILAVLSGAVLGTAFTVRQAMVADLVGPGARPNAMAFLTLAFPLSFMVSTGLAGQVIAGAGYQVVFLVAAACSGVSLFLLARVPGGISHVAPSTEPPQKMLLEGLRYVVNSRRLTMVVVAAVGGTLFCESYVAMLPVFQKDVLGVGADGLGWLFAANGLGGVVGAAAVAAALRSRKPGGRALIATGLFQAGFLLGFALSKDFALSIGFLVIDGFLATMFLALSLVLIQEHTDESYQARVFAIRTVAWGLAPLGHILVGGLALAMGPQSAVAAVALMGITAFLMVGLWVRLDPERSRDTDLVSTG